MTDLSPGLFKIWVKYPFITLLERLRASVSNKTQKEDTRLYITAETLLDVELDPNGEVVDVWYGCKTLPFQVWCRDEKVFK